MHLTHRSETDTHHTSVSRDCIPPQGVKWKWNTQKELIELTRSLLLPGPGCLPCLQSARRFMATYNQWIGCRWESLMWAGVGGSKIMIPFSSTAQRPLRITSSGFFRVNSEAICPKYSRLSSNHWTFHLDVIEHTRHFHTAKWLSPFSLLREGIYTAAGNMIMIIPPNRMLFWSYQPFKLITFF